MIIHIPKNLKLSSLRVIPILLLLSSGISSFLVTECNTAAINQQWTTGKTAEQLHYEMG